jgi:hypothetical protein
VPDPLDDARALLMLSRLLYRARVRAAACGIQPAPAAVQALKPIGRRLAAAVEAAEQAAEGPDRGAALEEVARVAEELSATIDGQWEGLGAVVSIAIDGVRGLTPILPSPRPRSG